MLGFHMPTFSTLLHTRNCTTLFTISTIQIYLFQLLFILFNSPNISRISRALSPMYLSTMADDTTFRKLASSWLATALAKRVLPVPGGP